MIRRLPPLALAAIVAGVATLSAQQDAPPPPVDPFQRPFDAILDTYVRDGFVYYGALKVERARFDRYLASLADVPASDVAAWSPARQLAFWVNAYNALVLQTVIDHFPIRGVSPLYPADSVRQIPGAFEQRPFSVAGRVITLDGIEKDIITGFRDARALLALGRGSVGGGRLRSEAFTADRLDAQLQAAADEVVTRREMVQVDIATNVLSLSPIFSWREAVFDDQWKDRAAAVFAARSPVERAALALIDPVITPREAAFLQQNQFRTVFHDYDWRLNDLATRGR